MEWRVCEVPAKPGQAKQFGARKQHPELPQEQTVTVPMDLREWFPADVLANWVEENIEKLRAQEPAGTAEIGRMNNFGRTMLSLLCFSYAIGIFESRSIELDSRTNTPLRLLSGSVPPLAGDLRRFRRRHGAVLTALLFELFVRAASEHFGAQRMAGGPELHAQLLEAASQRLDIAIQFDLMD